MLLHHSNKAARHNVGMKLASLFIGAALSVVASPASAQPVRYMDKAGNILFVEKLADVPDEYRRQLVVPTPAPVMTKELMKQMKATQEENARVAKQQARKEREQELESANQARKAARREEAERRKNDESKDMRVLGNQ